MRRRMMLVAAATLAGAIALTPRMAVAEGLFELFFGGVQKQQQQKAPPQANFFADPFGLNPPQPAPSPRQVASGSGPAFCVRSCDGRYFPLTTRGNASPVQICQAFCPASPTKVFFGSNIDGATSASGERYADSDNAYTYRKAMRADCTCNGRDPAGLAPVDLTLDTSLRPGDVIAFPTGERGAHRISNEGDTSCVVLMFANIDAGDVCHYPDSRKLLVEKTGTIVRSEPELDYFEGER